MSRNMQLQNYYVQLAGFLFHLLLFVLPPQEGQYSRILHTIHDMNMTDVLKSEAIWSVKKTTYFGFCTSLVMSYPNFIYLLAIFILNLVSYLLMLFVHTQLRFLSYDFKFFKHFFKHTYHIYFHPHFALFLYSFVNSCTQLDTTDILSQMMACHGGGAGALTCALEDI